ncbi:putative diphthamide synthesis protein-domain-containing protein [Boeremia exigua]|uniref:putative diphthamide synthesis protein-domain-containing protein n=1 Tax=Boeremia exigua TaxID=749465 RepID=UPI001E8E6F62|nr:putative diphthamide synthesis protein-domain-containing protein [Boeremia exigua]KAH6633436.1 putative diphthamide synthesis protein-domain-containing protein [Boeremia exigua]
MTALAGAPVLSTPEAHLFEAPAPVATSAPLSDEQVSLTYEIARTVQEIRAGRWKRVALQFPDHMLGDAPRVFEQLSRGLAARRAEGGERAGVKTTEATTVSTTALAAQLETNMGLADPPDDTERLFILGDTAYGACCVDEVAAEHVDADCVVHYGRSCLSPPARLPVIYVFTAPPLDLARCAAAFAATYPDRAARVVLMADIPFAHHLPALEERLRADGYSALFATQLRHDPAAALPNRSVPASPALSEWALFHVAPPPTALLLTLASRVASTHIYTPPAPGTDPPATDPVPPADEARAHPALRRRYALLSTLPSAPIIGILLGTLNATHLPVLAAVQRLIAAAGKKSYTLVVGKVNVPKLANFSEVGAWVVVGCWESGVVDGEGFWRPVVTAWEARVALEGAWTGEWRGDYVPGSAGADGEGGEGGEGGEAEQDGDVDVDVDADVDAHADGDADGDADSEEESEPPEFDLRTGRYVSHARPMRRAAPRPATNHTSPDGTSPDGTSATPASADTASTALAKRAPTALASINGVVSPGAEFLRSGRGWVGLGSDFHTADGEEDGDGGGNGGDGNGGGRAARMEEGRRGIARGYRVGEGGTH